MRLLHTSDWHVGKAIRGRSRAQEHQAVLAEVAGIADREAVDLVIVAGDVFDTSTPTAESERIVYRALLDLAAGGRPVIVVAGNHDSAPRLQAVAPLSEASGIRVASAISPGDAADAHAAYADRVVRIVRTLTDRFRADTVNLVVAHLMVMGGAMGGGERSAHTVFDYWVPATAFPPAAHYVALGHLHRAQQLAGPAPLYYCGSPLQLDFGETANDPVVNMVDVRPGAPARVRPVALTAGRRLRTLRGTLADVIAWAADVGTMSDDHVRIVLDEPARAGLADEVRAQVPNAVEVALAPGADTGDAGRSAAPDQDRLRRSPHDLLAEYLAERDAHDERVVALFDELVEEADGDIPTDSPYGNGRQGDRSSRENAGVAGR